MTQIGQDAVVMMSDPLPNGNPGEIRAWLSNHDSERCLADAYATTSNKAWWVEDGVYDYEEGTPEYEKAAAISDQWFELYDELRDRIFEILRSENVSIPETGQIVVLAPFMERHGYIDGRGWWIRTTDD